MTNLKGNLKKILGDLYGLRTWAERATKPPGGHLRERSHVEYGFRQCKQELGWTDYRLTNSLAD